ncbi:MAG: hypothetical protein ACXAEX_11540 [Promethearchaeota archaeon]|jgi:hypothetical protein
MRKKKYFIEETHKATKYYVFLGIIAFLICFPFLALNLRFQLGYVFTRIFDYIGMICFIVGGWMTIINVLNIFVSRNLRPKWVITGIALLWIGCWLTGSVFNFFMISVGNEPNPPGYH